MAPGCRKRFVDHADDFDDLVELEIEPLDTIVLFSHAFEIALIALSYLLIRRSASQAECNLHKEKRPSKPVSWLEALRTERSYKLYRLATDYN